MGKSERSFRKRLDLWNEPDYAAYRERVQGFAFPPCSFCGGCEMLEANKEDCLGNGFPACGSCLWAQGVIQSPLVNSKEVYMLMIEVLGSGCANCQRCMTIL